MENQWHHLQSRLKRYLGRMLRRPEDVEDIAQEAFVRVLEAGSKGEIHFQKAYLYKTAHNLALNSLARKANVLVDYMADFPELDVIAEGASVEDQVAAQRRFELFCRTVAELPEQCRRVLVLRKVYGLSQQEVADRLGIAISTVEKHLAKGMVHCAAQMQRAEASSAADQTTQQPQPLRRGRRHQP